MITIEQCRGARGILGWTQQDLADASGLSKTAINNFEKGHSDIKAESLRAIRMAFESTDIEFIGESGVAKKTESFKIIRGEFALSQLIDDMHKTIKNTETEILISFVDENLANRLTTQKIFKHIEFIKNNNIKQRILCFTGSDSILSPTEECRWISEDYKTIATTTYIYGDKIAHELWDQSMIIVTRSVDAAKSERARFEKLWQAATIPEELSNNSQRAINNN
ncbi:MAG: helix-turn-helix transcriptional regulator [Alphaproteobacteria bacterium]|nr:helix-turn-helix transcriptional regulator [Alphaproteobacteria bacterium]